MILIHETKNIELHFEKDTGLLLKALTRVDCTQFWDDVTSVWFARYDQIQRKPMCDLSDDEIYFLTLIDDSYAEALRLDQWNEIEATAGREENRCKEDIEERL